MFPYKLSEERKCLIKNTRKSRCLSLLPLSPARLSGRGRRRRAVYVSRTDDESRKKKKHSRQADRRWKDVNCHSESEEGCRTREELMHTITSASPADGAEFHLESHKPQVLRTFTTSCTQSRESFAKMETRSRGAAARGFPDKDGCRIRVKDRLVQVFVTCRSRQCVYRLVWH